MTDVVVLFRNAPRLAERCLGSLRTAAIADAQYLLVDDCSDAAERLMGMSRNLVGLIRIRDAMGGAEMCPDCRLRQINRYIGGKTVQR